MVDLVAPPTDGYWASPVSFTGSDLGGFDFDIRPDCSYWLYWGELVEAVSLSTVICVLPVSIRASQLEKLNLVPVLRNSKLYARTTCS